MAKSKLGNTFAKVIDKWNLHPYFRLFIYIVATSLVLYWQFIFGDKVYASKDYVVDMYQQYLKVYEFFANGIRNGELTSYTFQYGYGNSIFSMLDWISDPFSILGVIVGVIFGVEYIADSMIYILILKHICAGLLCFCFLREFKFSIKSSLVSAYLYAFAGYMLTMGQHYFFANRPVFFILILLILEKMIKDSHKIKYWCGLLYVSFLITLSGVTAAYEIFLAAGFYALFRVIYIYGQDYKKIVQRLGICLVFVLGGIALSSFTLFPSIERILASDRITQNVNIFSLNDPLVIRAGVLRLFSNHLDGFINQYYGSFGGFCYDFPYFFSILLVPIIAQYISVILDENITIVKKILKILIVVILTLTIIFKTVPLMFSFFVPHYHSFVYVFYPFYAVTFALVLDNIERGRFSRLINYITLFISLVVIIWGGIETNNNGSDTALMNLIISSVMLIVGCVSLDLMYLSSKISATVLCEKNIKRISSLVLIIVIVLNMISENYIIANYRRAFATKDISHTHLLTTDIINSVNNQEKDNFFRFETKYIEGRMPVWNTYSFMFPIRTTAYYETVIENKVPDFYKQIFGSSGNMKINNYSDMNKIVNNSITEDILGLKYLLLASDLKRNGWEKIEEYPEKDIALYQNMGINSAGLLFDSYVTQNEADDMSFGDRAIGMATRLIIDNPAENIDDFALKYTKDTDSNISYEDKINKKSLIDIDTVLPYNGTVDEVSVTDNGCIVKATMDGEDSNFRFSINADIVNDINMSTQLSFKLKNGNILKNFVYYGADNYWKEVPDVKTEIESGLTVYSFIIPKDATGLALCVNQSCRFDVDISSKTFENPADIIKPNSIYPYNGTVDNIVETSNGYVVKANMFGKDSNFRFSLDTGILNNSKTSTQITFKLNDGNVVKDLVYLDRGNAWIQMPKVKPEEVNGEFAYTFIIPQTAEGLALSVNQACELDVDISTKTVTATYVNEGIQLDNPKRGSALTGTVTAQKNSLLYLPIPYNKYWNAYIDGEKVDIMKANYAFMALPITAGEHTVDLRYSNEMFNIFLKVSIGTFILYNAFFVFCFIVKYRGKKSLAIYRLGRRVGSKNKRKK